MVGTTIRSKGFIADFLTPFLPKINGEPTKKGLTDLHQLVSGNAASVASNLRGGRHGHIALMMTAKEYMAQTEFAFVPPHNSVDYPQSM